jgi:hypothetical protein
MPTSNRERYFGGDRARKAGSIAAATAISALSVVESA